MPLVRKLLSFIILIPFCTTFSLAQELHGGGRLIEEAGHRSPP